MNKHELFDLIGEADENYVDAADKTAKHSKSHWRAWAACAACAVLVLGVYPAYRALTPQQTPLHSYTVVEGTGGGYWTEQANIKAPYQGSGAEFVPGDDVPPVPEPTLPPRGSGPDAGADIDGNHYSADVPLEEAPYNQYISLLENAHLDEYPEWYGGAYIGYADSGEPSKLVVCIVEGFHTPELEQQIAEWCGEGVWAYQDVKYSRGYLQELMERLNSSQFLSTMEADKAIYSWGVYEDENCVRMDCNGIPNDATLAALAQLDPDGDAIQVRVFAGVTADPDIVKGPAPFDGPTATPVPGGAQDGQPPAEPSEPAEDPIAVEPTAEPTAIEPEQGQPAQYNAYNAISGGAAETPQAQYGLLPLDE